MEVLRLLHTGENFLMVGPFEAQKRVLSFFASMLWQSEYVGPRKYDDGS